MIPDEEMPLPVADVPQESKQQIYRRLVMQGVNYGGDNAYPDAFPYNQSDKGGASCSGAWGLRTDRTIW